MQRSSRVGGKIQPGKGHVPTPVASAATTMLRSYLEVEFCSSAALALAEKRWSRIDAVIVMGSGRA